MSASSDEHGLPLNSMRSVYRICAAATALLLAYAALLSFCSIAGFPGGEQTGAHWPWLGNKPVGEDGFYMLTVADNIARSGHIVYNYGHAATGIQPLSTVVFAGIAWLVHRMHGDEWTLIRFMIFEGALLFAGFAWGMGFLVASLGGQSRRPLVFAIAFFLTLFDFDLFRLFTYGLETGIYLCLEAACFWVSLGMMRSRNASWRQVWILGVLGGAAGLARIDFGILFAILLCWMLVRRVVGPLQAFACGLIALAITCPWFLFVHSVSGSWLPSSGRSESRLFGVHDGARFRFMGDAISVHLFPWIYSNLPWLAFSGLTAISLATFVLLLARSQPARSLLRRYLTDAAPWIAGLVTLVVTYLLFFGVITFYVRYISLLFLVAMPVVAQLLAEWRVVAARPALALGPLAMIFAFYCISTLHTGHLGNNWLVDAGYIRQYYPEAHVASFQSGTIGYFDRNVDNLDGKLNMDALKGYLDHRMDDYVDRAGINVLVEWPDYIRDNFSPAYIKRSWEPCPQPMYPGGGMCLVRRTAISAAGK